jgi:hypothetical protein
MVCRYHNIIMTQLIDFLRVLAVIDASRESPWFEMPTEVNFAVSENPYHTYNISSYLQTDLLLPVLYYCGGISIIIFKGYYLLRTHRWDDY